MVAKTQPINKQASQKAMLVVKLLRKVIPPTTAK